MFIDSNVNVSDISVNRKILHDHS